jgi:succinate dehydrogenase / fumarate reductase, iron-sulfur subunit
MGYVEMQVVVQILRQNPGEAPRLERYPLTIEPGNTVLDCLNKIKWEQDGSLAFRRNCRNTICGSCAMRVNGRATLACKENIGSETARFSTTLDGLPCITAAPLGNLPVIRDLVVDMKGFWDHLKAVDPQLQTAAVQASFALAPEPANLPEPASENSLIVIKEFRQTPEQRDRLSQSGNCIQCGACYSECNALTVNPNFVGPHALAKAYRMVADNRDDQTAARLAQYGMNSDHPSQHNPNGVWGCTRCGQCDTVCPMEVAPLEQISKIKAAILAQPSPPPSRAVRHRQQLVELVKAGGWIDERKFGMAVVGNGFKDLAGLASLAPLGLRMLSKGKLPGRFEPSEGASEVRSLIESVQAFQAAAQNAESAE